MLENTRSRYMDVDGGFTTRIDANLFASAEFGYQFAVSNQGGGQRDGLKGSARLRYQW